MQPLQLISIGGIMTGGTTRPVNIIALDENGNPNKYIMKVFTEKNILQNVSVAKEIICSELARDFDLICPNYSIINFDHSEIIDLYDEHKYITLDKGYKFCSEFVEQNAIFNPLVTNSFLKDYEAANIFAFDLFVYNVDRGGEHNKPNLLINDTSLILIDHELTFPFINDTNQIVDYEIFLGNYQFQKHILIKHLRSLRNKEGIFDGFLEMLKHLNINNLSAIFDEMDKFNISYVERQKFIHYFVWAKNNVVIFERYLKGMIG
ncbi:HipA family kinase [Flavobacterium eburneipallidum]|uniref:HipA family kinase n=1 Tax=Flavobacterium eburneipallidum TaxID=3003263 RepID=UPI0022AC0FFD|nr:HipA family kinase [Flavobacterium eburneipallidum]